MTDLLSLLPTPKYQFSKQAARESAPTPVAAKVIEPPAYGQRGSFLPRTPEDFGEHSIPLTFYPAQEYNVVDVNIGDGGAFPEIHLMQYPLEMGRKNNNSTALARTAPLQVDSEGNVKYDMILRQNMRKDVVVYSQYNDLVERDLPDEQLVKPSVEVRRDHNHHQGNIPYPNTPCSPFLQSCVHPLGVVVLTFDRRSKRQPNEPGQHWQPN